MKTLLVNTNRKCISWLNLIACLVAAGWLSTAQAQSCLGMPATIVCDPDVDCIGTAGNDVIVGTNAADIIEALDGDDVVCGRRGADQIEGGRGDDFIRGNRGADDIYGNRGDDIIWGDRGHDFLEGNRGSDVLSGGNGNDIVRGGRRDDVLLGGAGLDECDGGSGNDDEGLINGVPTCEDVINIEGIVPFNP